MNAEHEPELGPGPGPEPEEERELSVLLERAVPRFPAPHDRMAQIRRRVRRSTRRRATAGAVAAFGGVTAAALVAAALLQPPDTRGHGGQQVLPAASSGRAVPDGDGTMPSSTADPQYRLITLAPLSGLELKLPGTNWRSLVTTAPNGLPVGFVGSQPLRERADCAKRERAVYGVCPPVDKLAEGGVLIAFAQEKRPMGENTHPGWFMVKGAADAGEECRALGGQKELTAWGEDPDVASPFGLMVRACFSRPSADMVDAVGTSLKSAVYSPASP